MAHDHQHHHGEQHIEERVSLAGMWLSLLCAIHCMSVPVIMLVFPVFFAGVEFLDNPLLELSIMGAGLLLSGTVVVRDYIRTHHDKTILLSVFGGFALSFAGVGFHHHWYGHVLLIAGSLSVAYGVWKNYKAHRKVCKA